MNIQIWGDGHPDTSAQLNQQVPIQGLINISHQAAEGPPNLQAQVRPRGSQLKVSAPDLDPIGKREAQAKSARQSKKAAILQARRQEAAEASISVFYFNCRGLNSEWKQQLLMQHVTADADVLMIAETKLTKRWALQGHFSMQTQRRRHGGCYIASNNKQAKAIKALNTSIAWATIKVAKRLIHCITCYLQPAMADKREVFLQQLEGILSSMRLRDPSASVILAGDFNEARPSVDAIAARAGLHPIIDPQQPTHNAGGMLDQMYTNLGVVSSELRNIDPRITDHKGISAKLRVAAWRQPPTQPEEQKSNITIGRITREAARQSTIQKLLERDSIIGSEAIHTFHDQLQPRNFTPRWYRSIRKQSPRTEDDTLLGHAHESLRRQEWKDMVERLETLHRNGDWRQFYQITKQMTSIQHGGKPIKGIVEGDNEILDPDAFGRILAEKYRVLYGHGEDQHDEMMSGGAEIFTEDDIEEAIKSSNFNKGIGPDGFNGKTLDSSQLLRSRFKKEVVEALNSAKIPKYLRQGRLTALSKIYGKDAVPFDDIRPIVIRSHISKIMEKAILSRSMKHHSHLLETLRSQTGFKQGMGTHHNITKILSLIHPGRGRKERRALLFIDLQKAYDSVSRHKLGEILLKRCRSNEDRHVVNLIMQLVNGSIIHIGNEKILTLWGLPQGSVLAPLLFNIYLEEALKSNERLWYKYRCGFLLAYADDMVTSVSSEGEALTTIDDLKALEREWNLRLNLKKSEILGLGQDCQIGGVKCVTKVKYLGVLLSIDLKEQRAIVLSQSTRNLARIKRRLWITNIEVKECVLNAFLRSLLLYMGLPMRASNIWSKKDVKSIESRLYREIHGIPKDIANDVLTNVMQHTRPAAECIEQKVLGLRQAINRVQTLLPRAEQQGPQIKSSGVTTPPQRPKLYLPKVVAHTMLALVRGRTVIYFNERHRCVKHQCIIDDQHIRECEEFEDIPNLTGWIKMLREKNLRDWLEDDRNAAIVSFGLLKLRLEEMKSCGGVEQITLSRNSKPQVGAPTMSPQESQGLITTIKKKRGRPKKVDVKMLGYMTINQFFVGE